MVADNGSAGRPDSCWMATPIRAKQPLGAG
jgi:hypothetical protein